MTILEATNIDDQLVKAYRGWDFDRLSDTALAQEVARSIRRPRRDPADSFVLHAPLELTARLALLPYLSPDHREVARLRMFSIAGRFDAFGPAVDEPTTTTDFDTAETAETATARLVAAIEASDLEAVDAAAVWLGTHVDGARLRSLLADTIVARLSAAAHGSIFLYQLPRIAPRGELTTELLRPLARELARYPDWQLAWTRVVSTAAVAESEPGDRLLSALAATPQLGMPGSDFIFPVMSQVDDSGVASAVLADSVARVDVASGARAILRAAAWSMLAEPETHVPYGWTHCLTLPQAALGVARYCANPRAALAVAATYVVGFRAAFAVEPLVAGFEEPAPHVDLATALRSKPSAASAAVWHAGPMADAEIVTELASRAAVHVDAHFVKYTLACIDAAHFDPTHSRLYLAAAARLAAFWATR